LRDVERVLVTKDIVGKKKIKFGSKWCQFQVSERLLKRHYTTQILSFNIVHFISLLIPSAIKGILKIHMNAYNNFFYVGRYYRVLSETEMLDIATTLIVNILRLVPIGYSNHDHPCFS